MFSKKNKLLPLGLSFRLTFAYLLFFTASVTIIFASLYFIISSTLQKKDRDLISFQHHVLEHVLSKGGLAGLTQTVKNHNPELKSWVFIQLISGTGKVLFQQIPSDSVGYDFSNLVKERMNELAPLDKEWLITNKLESESQVEILSSPQDDGTILQVGRLNDNRSSELHSLYKSFIILTTPLLFILFVGGIIVVQRYLEPIQNLIVAVRRFEKGELNPQVPMPMIHDELYELSFLFNSMQTRSTKLIEGMKQSVENLAHDLRTPLAQFKISSDLALGREVGMGTTQKIDSFRDALVDGIESSERIQALIDSVMEISQAESGHLNLKKVDTNLNEIVADVIELYQDVSAEKNIQIFFNKTKLKEVSLDPQYFRRAIANLLDNAIKYGSKNSTIQIAIVQVATSSKLSSFIEIRDQGPGISDADLPYIWNRLYRADHSRSVMGLGLGLSLVKAIIEAHGAKIDCKTSPAGTCFSIWITSEKKAFDSKEVTFEKVLS